MTGTTPTAAAHPLPAERCRPLAGALRRAPGGRNSHRSGIQVPDQPLPRAGRPRGRALTAPGSAALPGLRPDDRGAAATRGHDHGSARRRRFRSGPGHHAHQPGGSREARGGRLRAGRDGHAVCAAPRGPAPGADAVRRRSARARAPNGHHHRGSHRAGRRGQRARRRTGILAAVHRRRHGRRARRPPRY